MCEEGRLNYAIYVTEMLSRFARFDFSICQATKSGYGM